MLTCGTVRIDVLADYWPLLLKGTLATIIVALSLNSGAQISEILITGMLPATVSGAPVRKSNLPGQSGSYPYLEKEPLGFKMELRP